MTTAARKAPSSHFRQALLKRFRERITANSELSRSLVSYQANRTAPFYGWFKYKEAFSAGLVESLLGRVAGKPGTLLDPFAGSGTALFAARSLGWDVIGIEIMPVGLFVAESLLLADRLQADLLEGEVEKMLTIKWEDHFDDALLFKHVLITKNAFPKRTERDLAGFAGYCQTRIADPHVRRLLHFACMCVLESVSYTRKDGQYLRWDHRSGKQLQSSFHKGRILSFDNALCSLLKKMIADLRRRHLGNGELFPVSGATRPGSVDLRLGSCLDLLPTIQDRGIDVILTSPPYCNRYDYTRTYALELVFLGYNNEQIKRLRQQMLSCTVENREKRDSLMRAYRQAQLANAFELVEEVFRQQDALHEVLTILDAYRAQGRLNNPNIVRMIKNYFYEMSFVIYEFSRVLRPGGLVVMVNDNVRYAGEEVPVDLILSNIAEAFGFTTQHIWTLQRGKGNSSQQMGTHGRSELRKCVYVWRR